jgi:L-threonylcarbamoyladenylate synthase
MAEISTSIDKAALLLTQGEVVSIPTETVYGLAANALDTNAVAKIFEVKNRPAFDPLIVHVPSFEAASAYADIQSKPLHKLANALCPGPITFILPKKSIIPGLVTSGHGTVGIRIPNHPLTLELLKTLSFPLAAPSANPFGFTSPTSAMHVQEQLGAKIPMILDGGNSSVGLESTIVEDTPNGVRVLRLGGVSIEQLEDALGEQVADVKTSSSNPNAPGMLSSHYNPGIPLIAGNPEELAKAHPGKRIAVMAFQSPPTFACETYCVLSNSGNTTEAASVFFHTLRELGKADVDLILAEFAPETGLGKAINDRLRRASV